MRQIPSGPVVDENWATTSPFMHFFNDMAENTTEQESSLSKAERLAQSIGDALDKKVSFNTFYGRKAVIGEFEHGLGEDNVRFCLSNYTVTKDYKSYSTSKNTIYTDFKNDNCFAWTTSR